MTPTASLALCCMSHSPLLNLPGPSRELLDDIDSALTDARDFVRDFDPELVVIFSPDHYNGFFYRLMPPFCIGTAAHGRRRLRHPRRSARTCPPTSPPHARRRSWDAGVDVAISASMDVDHGTVQPLQSLFGDVADDPGDSDLHQLGGHPARAASSGRGRSAPPSATSWRRSASACWCGIRWAVA